MEIRKQIIHLGLITSYYDDYYVHMDQSKLEVINSDVIYRGIMFMFKIDNDYTFIKINEENVYLFNRKRDKQ